MQAPIGLATGAGRIRAVQEMQEGMDINMDKLAQLARIRLTEEEKEAYGRQLTNILGYFQQLQAVDVGGIEPMAHPFEAEAPLREDQAGVGWAASRALANAPEQRENELVVPKVVEDA